MARAQGPELLKDRSLRLRTHLLAQKAEVNEVLSVSADSLPSFLWKTPASENNQDRHWMNPYL